ncbi:partner of Y14 and mago-like [Lingula anatina]|uniref:Partner of Y14 and mago n=1 Tax=Lingula anatina TaxID=7574 RepID=A0A1S3K099_LINAN|nr:partner of Y14 and mago [Lingula anatina]XP_013415967.1 partner of Y14 and mago-like [Lingula anatina]|eukprot:XP_013415966.1 partner of Y14 and mago [Lingula anatina]
MLNEIEIVGLVLRPTSMAMAGALERDGVVRDEEGNMFIPASRRPDGTWRKARRVKDGYVPQEEVPVYESKGTQFVKNKPTLPPGLFVEPDSKHNNPGSAGIPGLSKSAKKNAKRKEKKKQEAGDVTSLSSSLQETKLNDKEKDAKPEVKVDPAKRIKTLKKKIKQIEDLQARIDSGDLKEPDKDQLEKISRKQQILTEIEELELDLSS